MVNNSTDINSDGQQFYWYQQNETTTSNFEPLSTKTDLNIYDVGNVCQYYNNK